MGGFGLELIVSTVAVDVSGAEVTIVTVAGTSNGSDGWDKETAMLDPLVEGILHLGPKEIKMNRVFDNQWKRNYSQNLKAKEEDKSYKN